MKADTIYLIVAAGLIFGAGAMATKKILRRFRWKEILIMAPIAVAMVLLIWIFLGWWTRAGADVPLLPPAESTPLLRPDQD
jgi:hypothetical protein